MSLMLEFPTPQHREVSSVGIGTNSCFPTITLPSDAIVCKSWNDCAAQRESREVGPTRQSGNSNPATRFRDLPIAMSKLRKHQ